MADEEARMPRTDFNQLTWFQAVAEERSFTRAAARLTYEPAHGDWTVALSVTTPQNLVQDAPWVRFVPVR
jgi:hypothetical protein